MSLAPSLPLRSPSPRSQHGIPLRAHFVWFGQAFPWVNVLALRSAAIRGGFDEVVLHHDSDLSRTHHYQELVATPRISLRRLDLPALFARCAPYGSELNAVFLHLKSHAARSDLVRFALLYAEGGVYLDIDTVTLRSFEPLCRRTRAFCGEERLVYPASVRLSRNPFTHASALARSQLRSLLRSVPRGWAIFRHIEHWYHLGANPAVLASAAGSRFITQAIDRLVSVPRERLSMPCAIGPHLLQDVLESYAGDEVEVHPPQRFFPLGPEISEHWFRMSSSVPLDEVVADAYIVHWYASVRSKHIIPQIDPEYVRRRADRQLFSKLA
ncbi:MAG TPA: glycosyltransferase, partial [Polyangiaceae bacterium]|nr:glycosyltransferase [Polyangiaceae bacterium]